MRYLLRRILAAIATLLGMSVIVFLVLRFLPGDQITASYGIQSGLLTESQRQSLERFYGLDRPLVVQYISWLGSVLTGNLGLSLTSRQPVLTLIARALPVTIELAILSQIVGTLLGVAMGVMAATRPNTPGDVFAQLFGLLGLGVPNFVLGSAIVAVLAAEFRYFPSAGTYVGFFQDPILNLQQQMLPALTLGIGLAAAVMRTTRSAFLEVANQDYVRTARGKGLDENHVRWNHIFRNALIPIVTITGMQFGYLLGGALVVEQVFGLPGLGRLLLTGILQREFAVVQSTVLVIAFAFIAVNLLVDLTYPYIDPRVKLL